MDQNQANQAVNTPIALALSTILVPVSYNFKTVKLEDAEGKPIYEKDKDGNVVKDKEGKPVQATFKRDSFQTQIPVPTLESVFGLPEGSLPKQDVMEEKTEKDAEGKDVKVQVKVGEEYAQPEHRVIFDQIVDYLKNVGKAIVDESEKNEEIKFPEGTFDFASLSRKPKYERAGGSLPRELLEEMCESYTVEMKKAGKPEKGIKIACHYFMRRAKGLDAVRQEIVAKMRENLGAWYLAVSDEDKTKFAGAYELLDGRIKDALAEDASAVM